MNIDISNMRGKLTVNIAKDLNFPDSVLMRKAPIKSKPSRISQISLEAPSSKIAAIFASATGNCEHAKSDSYKEAAAGGLKYLDFATFSPGRILAFPA